MMSSLSIPDLDIVLRTLERHYFGSDKWDDLGLKLGLYKTTLDEIKSKCSRDPKERLTTMLETWLKKADGVAEKGGPTWISLALALRDMKEISVAEQIEKDYLDAAPSFTSSYRKSKVEHPWHKYDQSVAKAKQNVQLSTDLPNALSSQHTPPKIFETKHASHNDSISCLQKINFLHHYEKKFTLESALSIDDIKPDYRNGTKNPQLLFKLMLQKIMMTNHEFRKVFLYEVASNENEDEDADYIRAIQEEYQIATPEEYQIAIHPMDALIALLLCADDFLRQDLYSKLVSCQVAVPLLLPDPVANNIVFPLWAMRCIVKYWKYRRGDTIQSFEDRVINCHSRLVSFIRFSQPRNFSKSKLLNNVVSDTKHKFFIDYESKGSSVDRCLVDGLVEVCWYFPSGEENDLFNDVVTFANLRGNASIHRQQLDFLIAHSDMAFVFLEERDICSEKECLQMFASSKLYGKVIFVADSWSGNSKQEMKDLVPHLHACSYAFAALVRNDLENIVDFIRSKIKTRLNNKYHQLCLFEHQMMKNYCIKVDEDTEACKRGKLLATIIMKNVKDIPVVEVKEKVVPLQGPDLWQKWASLNKKQNRMMLHDTKSQGIEMFFVKKHEQKKDIRRKQQIYVQNLHVVLKTFMQVISRESGEVRDYFIQWLKFLMDDHSHAVLLDMQRECQSIKEELRMKKANAAQNKLKKLLQEKSEGLIQASFGIEHLFRELGQIYEASIEINTSPQNDVLNLPTIAAQLLISGMPLEIVDGDAAHIPLAWVTAVLEELSKLLHNPHVFVLSVLGVQSTGKSTLLNTLFGVQFAVSAGRCTRGAYCQLLKLDPEFSREAKCDYILVIDTEGSRAPELDIQDSQTHDNELATLVIGLAGVTIINIFGEVPADISDILQTTVHAFIRMKKVELRPSCQFVKQNVDIVAADKTKEGRQKFLRHLDDMTFLAARAQLDEGLYKCFSDVIKFDDKEDVHHFPSLWEGNPPMAPVNPAYSEAALKLKSRLISLCKSHSYISSLEDFTKRISMLWKAVLKENFIFSFRNTLEVEAYGTLNVEFGKWSWILQNAFLYWQPNTRNLVKSHTLNEMEKIEQDQIKVIQDKLDAVYDEIANDVCFFFENPNSLYTSVMIKWKAEFEQKVKNMRDDYKEKAQVFCTQLVQNRRADAIIEGIKYDHCDMFEKRVQALVAKGKESDAELDDLFDAEWKKRMEEINREYPRPIIRQDICHSITNALRSNPIIKPFDPLILQKIKERPLQERGQPLQLSIDKTHTNSHFLQHLIGREPDIIVKLAERGTKQFLSVATSYLNQPSIDSYESFHIQILLRKLYEAISAFEKMNDNVLKFTLEYRVDLALEVCGYALCVFTKIQENNIKNHPVTYMESMQNTFRATYKALCTQTKREKIAATCLTNFVLRQLHSSLQDRLAIALFDDLKSNNVIFTSNKTLKGNILLDLLHRQSFELYKVYLTDISQSYLYWIAEYIEDHCKQSVGGKDVITKLAEDELDKLMRAIIAAAEASYRTRSGVKQWLTLFKSYLYRVLPLNIQELHSLIEMEDDNDLKFFTEQFLEGLKEQRNNYLSTHQEVLDKSKWTIKPAEIIHNNIAGCCQQCPFCKEQCEGHLKHEGNHFCTLHRPKCLAGWHSKQTQEMMLETCTNLVASGSIRQFATPDSDELVYYKDYRTVYPNWSIPGEVMIAAPYWKWFVAQHKDKIAGLFGFKTLPLDQDWTCLTADDARNDIKKRYYL